MGQLKVVAGGLQLSGQALVLDMLRASTIRSRHGQPISLGNAAAVWRLHTEHINNFFPKILLQNHQEIFPSIPMTGKEKLKILYFWVTIN